MLDIPVVIGHFITWLFMLLLSGPVLVVAFWLFIAWGYRKLERKARRRRVEILMPINPRTKNRNW